MPKTPKKPAGYRLTQDEIDLIDHLADALACSKADVIGNAIRAFAKAHRAKLQENA